MRLSRGNRLELPFLPKRSSLGERRYDETHTGYKTSYYGRHRTAPERQSSRHFLTLGDNAMTKRQ
jgi:hypothetical protein